MQGRELRVWREVFEATGRQSKRMADAVWCGCREGVKRKGWTQSIGWIAAVPRTKPSNKKAGRKKGESRNSGFDKPRQRVKRAMGWDKRKSERHDEPAIRA